MNNLTVKLPSDLVTFTAKDAEFHDLAQQHGIFQLYVTKTGKMRIISPGGKEWQKPARDPGT